MAIFENDPFPGTDYSQYQSWKTITTPEGGVYYEVPGHPEYVLDIVASNATGRKVFRANPKLSIEKQREEEADLNKLKEQQEFNQSPAGQLLPVAAGTGGMIAAQQFAPVSPIEQAIASQITGTSAGANAAAQGALEAPNVLSVTQGAGGVAPVVPGIGITPYFGAAGAALGAYGVHNAIQNNDPRGGAISGLGLGLGAGMAAPLLGLGPLGWGGLGLMAAGGALGGYGLTEAFGHESTREKQAKHTEQLIKASPDQTYQDYVAGMREQHKYAPPDPSKPFLHGTYRTWDEYKKAGLQASDLTGVYGNIKTFGPEWASLTQSQREAVTQGLIDADLYKPKAGEVEIKDPAKAQEIKNSVLQGFNVGAVTQAQAAARSSTLSPGIGLDGRPFSYPVRR